MCSHVLRILSSYWSENKLAHEKNSVRFVSSTCSLKDDDKNSHSIITIITNQSV